MGLWDFLKRQKFYYKFEYSVFVEFFAGIFDERWWVNRNFYDVKRSWYDFSLLDYPYGDIILWLYFLKLGVLLELYWARA